MFGAGWCWLVQFGLGKAGFYSYELLERAVGIPVVNVESVQAQWQDLTVGGQVLLHPKAPPIPVGKVTPERDLCFGEDSGNGHGHTADKASEVRRSFSMYVRPAPEGGCRLLVRGCVGSGDTTTWKTRLGLAIEAPIDMVMEQRMLRTIKRLAESRSRSRRRTNAEVP